MKNSKILMAVLSGVLAFAVQGYGQSMFQIKLKGTVQTTNDVGNIVSTKLSNNSLIHDAVVATGITNSSGLQVVYVQSPSTDPSVPGDFIEVVDNAGTPVYTNLLLLYGSPFPSALTNAAGSEIVIGAQVVPLPLGGSGDTLGGATITERIAKKTVLSGNFNYVMLRSPGSSFNDATTVINGSFTASKPFVAR